MNYKDRDREFKPFDLRLFDTANNTKTYSPTLNPTLLETKSKFSPRPRVNHLVSFQLNSDQKEL